MNSVKKKIIIIVVVLGLAGAGLAYVLMQRNTATPPTTSQPAQAQEVFNKKQYSTSEPGSLWWVVNKKRPLPENYEPPELAAPNMRLRWAADAEAMQVSKGIAGPLAEMYQATKAAGFDLMLISGYRSAVTQKQLYDTYVAQQGQEEADRLSAKPGTSEHQTGMAVDLGRVDTKCEFESCFGETPEGKWLADHAHEYGFVVRYLPGKEAVTGYMYEPWHLRYVGKPLAAELHAGQQTLEEFFDLSHQ